MIAFQINDQEREALQGLSHLQRCVYVFGLRPYMDFKTGIVGSAKRRISYQSLAEEMYVNPAPGVSNTGSPSRDQLRRAIYGLERAGLICIESTNRHLIVRCVLATLSSFKQNKAASMPPTVSEDQISAQNLNNISVWGEIEQSKINVIHSQAATPQESIINNKNKIIFEKKLVPISQDYLPTSDLIARAEKANCPIPIGDQLLLFISHCQSKQIISADWDAEYMKWLLRGKVLQKPHYRSRAEKTSSERRCSVNAFKKPVSLNRYIESLSENPSRLSEDSNQISQLITNGPDITKKPTYLFPELEDYFASFSKAECRSMLKNKFKENKRDLREILEKISSKNSILNSEQKVNKLF